MTQRQLAGKLGLTYQQVQHYESGTDNITASRLQEIALALDVSPGSFFPPHKELPSAWGSRDKQAGSE
jgi:transcriptional regulator with XRE-family HTH domain